MQLAWGASGYSPFLQQVEQESTAILGLASQPSTWSAVVGSGSSVPQVVGTSVVDGSAGDGNISVTVPVGATSAVAIWSHWDNNAQSFLSLLSLAGSPFQFRAQLLEGTTIDESGVGVAWLPTLPVAGSQLCAWTWSAGGARENGGEIVIYWCSGIDTDDPIRDVDIVATIGSGSVSLTVDSSLQDLILAFAQRYLSGSVGLDGTGLVVNAVLNKHVYSATKVFPQEGSTTVNMSGESWTSMAVISLKAPSAVPITPAITLTGGSSTFSASMVTGAEPTFRPTISLSGERSTWTASATHEPEHFAAVNLSSQKTTFAASLVSEPLRLANVSLTSGPSTFTVVSSFDPTANRTANISLTSSASSFASSLSFVAAPYNERHITFHLDNRFLTEGDDPGTVAQIKQRLVKYITNMNLILAEGTSLRFVFDPDEDIFFHPQSEVENPPSDTGSPFPDNWKLGVWVIYNDSPTGVSGQGHAFRTAVDEWSTVFTYWRAIWSDAKAGDISQFVSNTSRTVQLDFVIQMSTVLHETGHHFGLGISEFYTKNTMFDNSGVGADLSVSIGVGTFWTPRQLPRFDPMMGRGGTDVDTLAEWLDVQKFCPLSAAIINGRVLRTLTPECLAYNNLATPCVFIPTDFSSAPLPITVEVLRADNNGAISGAVVEMFGVVANGFGPMQSMTTPMGSQVTNSQGKVTFSTWGANGNIDNSFHSARMFKVTAFGFNPNDDGWLTCFDMQAWKFLASKGELNDWHYHDKRTIKLTQ